MAMNLRKYTAMNIKGKQKVDSLTKNGFNHQRPMIETIFYLFLASFVPASGS